MSKREDASARLMAALDSLENLVPALLDAGARAAEAEGKLAQALAERDGLLRRVAELEDENRHLAGLTETVETRLDGAIAEIRSALAR